MHKKELHRCPMFKRLPYLFCLVFFILLATNAGAATNQNINVMTMNLYLGADLAPVFAAQSEGEFLAAAQAALAQVAYNNFPARAQALAAEIVAKNPQLVSLQEVYNFTINGYNGSPPWRDYLEDLKAALADQGANYTEAAIVKNVDIQVYLGGNLVGVTDRDVILRRSDVTTTVVSFATSTYCRPSEDGCNYQAAAIVSTPIGTISLDRGFVAVDATLNGTLVRFVDTHLELPYKELAPTAPIASIYQAMQAFDLISILAQIPNPNGAKIIVAGDINSTPVDQILQVGPPYNIAIVPPYMQFVLSGYTDAWTLRPGNPPGFTCCQAENLLNLDSILSDRRDVTFSKEMPYGMVMVNLVGNEETDKTPSGLWPSDHAGVVTRMQFAQ